MQTRSRSRLPPPTAVAAHANPAASRARPSPVAGRSPTFDTPVRKSVRTPVRRDPDVVRSCETLRPQAVERRDDRENFVGRILRPSGLCKCRSRVTERARKLEWRSNDLAKLVGQGSQRSATRDRCCLVDRSVIYMERQ